MNKYGVDVDTLLTIAEEYRTKGVEAADDNKPHISATLINQSIVIYTFIVDKHDDPSETTFYLPFEKLMHAYVKLIDLLANYTTNWTLAKKITQKALFKFDELNQRSITNEQNEIRYILYTYFYYTIPLKMFNKSPNKKELLSAFTKSYFLFEQHISMTSLPTDWKVMFTIFQVSLYFKLEDVSEVDLSEALEYLDKNVEIFKAGNPDVFIYVQLSKACYFLSKNDFENMNKVIVDNGGVESIEKFIGNKQLLMSFYLILLYKDLVDGVQSTETVSKIHKLLTTYKKCFVKNADVFFIKSSRSGIKCECNFLDYSYLKDILLFFQGVRSLDRGALDYHVEMSDMFFKRIVKSKTVGKWANSRLKYMVDYYRSWQELHNIKDIPDQFRHDLPYNYLKMVTCDPTIGDIDDFMNKFSTDLLKPQHADMLNNLNLQRAVLKIFHHENIEKDIKMLNELKGNELFMDTARIFTLVYTRVKILGKSGPGQNTTSIKQHDAFLRELKEMSTQYSTENLSVVNGFLFVILSILRIDVEDTRSEKFRKYFSLMIELTKNHASNYLSKEFFTTMINYLKDLGQDLGVSPEKIEPLNTFV